MEDILGKKSTERVKFGPGELSTVSLNSVVILPQVRQTFSREGIAELADSIVLGDASYLDVEPTSAAFALNNPIITASFTDIAAACRYVMDHADHYEIEPTLTFDQLADRFVDDGVVTVLIAGNRRVLAVSELANRFGINRDDIDLSAVSHENISFADGLGLQLRENVYERPPVYDEARAIERFYRDIVKQTGKKPPLRDFAAKLGFSETKVRDALTFTSLPKVIQAFADTGALSYSMVQSLAPLADAYRQFHKRQYATQPMKGPIDQLVEDSLYTFCNNELLSPSLKDDSKKKSTSTIAKLIKNKTEEILSRAVYQQGEFLFASQGGNFDDTARARSSRRLGVQACAILEAQHYSGDIDQDVIERLQALLLKSAQKLAVSTGELLELDLEGLAS